MLKKLALIFLMGCSNQVAEPAVQNQGGFNLGYDTVITKTDTIQNDTLAVGAGSDVDAVIQDTEDAIENPQDVGLAEDTQEDVEEIVEPCVDEDGDEYGSNCELGEDCDDTNPNFTVECPDCSKGNVVGCSCKTKSATCYSYDPITLGKGVCKKGLQLCTNGFWQECNGRRCKINLW